MTMTSETLAAYLHDAGMNLEESRLDRPSLMYYLPVFHTRLKVFAELDEESALLQFYCFPVSLGIPNVSALARDVLLEQINSFNREYRYGRWSIEDDGDARVQFTFFLDDAPFSRRQLARIHYLLMDLMIHQAQALQISALLEHSVSHHFQAVSAVAVRAALDHPNQVALIAQAIHATPPITRLLYDVAGMIYSTPSDEENDAQAGDDSNVSEAQELQSALGSQGRRGVH